MTELPTKPLSKHMDTGSVGFFFFLPNYFVAMCKTSQYPAIDENQLCGIDIILHSGRYGRIGKWRIEIREAFGKST